MLTIQRLTSCRIITLDILGSNNETAVIYRRIKDSENNVITIGNVDIPVNGNSPNFEMAAIDFDLNGDDELIFLDIDGLKIYDIEKTGDLYNVIKVYERFFTGKFRVGDFTGDAIPDIFIIGSINQMLIGRKTDNDYIELNLDSNIFGNIANFVTVTDINGDKILEIITKADYYSYCIWSFSINNGYYHEGDIDISMQQTGIDVFFTDVNGDEKTDVLYFKDGKKYVRFSYGFDFYTDAGSFEQMDLPAIVEDLNNDGRVDFLDFQIYQDSIKLSISYTLPNGINTTRRTYTVNNISTTNFENDLEISIADLDGNGIKDILFGFYEVVPFDDLDGLIFKLYKVFANEVNRNVITGILDGQNVLRKIAYTKCIQGKVTETFPVCRSREKIPVVSDFYVVGSDGFKKWDWKTYSFSKPLMHLSGKGFLGFKERSIRSYSNSLKTTECIITKSIDSLYTPTETFYHLFPYKIEISVGDTIISLTENKFDIYKSISEDILCYFPVITQSTTWNWEKDASHTYKGIKIFKQSIKDFDKFGNSIFSETFADEYIFDPDELNFSSTKSTKISYNNLESDWLISRPDSVISTYCQKDEEQGIPQYSRNVTKYNYYNGIKHPANFIEFIENIPNGNLSLKNEIWYLYDMFGNITSKKHKAIIGGIPKERTIEFEYRDDLTYEGRFLTAEIVKAAREEEDIIKRYDYYLSSGLLKSEIIEDNNQLTKTYEYDKFGKLIKTTNPDLTSQVINYEWVNSGNCEITPPDSALYYTFEFQSNSSNTRLHKKFNFYDKYGRQLVSAKYGLKGDTNAICYNYDGFGRLFRSSEPYNYTKCPNLYNTVHYDLLGRVISEYYASGINISNTFKGRTTKVINKSTGIWKETTVNSIGLVCMVNEMNIGNIIYTYDALGKIRRINSQGSPTYYEYDDAGNPLKIIDPDADTIKYTYNAFGELITQSDSNLNEFMFFYDEIGRLQLIENIKDSESTAIYYIKNKQVNGFGKIEKIEKNNFGNPISTTYLYDNLSRLAIRSESIDGKIFDFKTEYDPNTGKIFSYVYPSGLKLIYSYDEFGYLNQIKNDASSKVLWTVIDANPREQITSMNYGGNLVVTNEFDNFGYITGISTTKLSKGIEEIIQNLKFYFDPLSGNLMKRTDDVRNLKESFTYDTKLMSRLTSWEVGTEKYSVDYADNGNIDFKSDVTTLRGKYNYDANKIHQVVDITYPTSEYLQGVKEQICTYTAFNKVNTISQKIGLLDVELKFTYGTDHNRIKSVLSTRGTPLETNYYFDDFEIHKSGSGPEEQIHYLYATDGLFAIIRKGAGSETLYYILKDHQGSYNQITDETGITVELLSFDPWGRRRNPLTWSYTNAPASSMFNRGYTGHEHLDNFGLINMNGRMYDPYIGRFFSPDPILQNPGSTQGHNRYSYVLNNPLKYTDPSGYVRRAECYDRDQINYGFRNWGRQYGGIIGNYWANDYRSEGSNFVLLSRSSFTNIYGSKKYQSYYLAVTGQQIEVSPLDFWKFASAVNSLRSANPLFYYLIESNSKNTLVSSNSPVNYFYFNEDGSVSADRDSEGFLPGMDAVNVVDIFVKPWWLSDIYTGINAFGFANSAKSELIDYAVRSNYKSARTWSEFNKLTSKQQAWRTTHTLGKTGAKYLKYVKGAGFVGAGLTTAYSIRNVYNYYESGGTDWSVYAKSGLDVIMTGVGFLGPIGFGISASYFILDATTGGFGGFGGIKP